MNLENNIFTSAEEKSMTQSGYLKRDEKNFIYRKLYVMHWDFDMKKVQDREYCLCFLNIKNMEG